MFVHYFHIKILKKYCNDLRAQLPCARKILPAH